MTGRVFRNRSLLWLPRAGLRVGLGSLLLLAGGKAVQDATASNETRTLSFHHTHSDENLTVTFKRSGRYDEDALKKINHYLRDWRSQDETVMDRRLFDILWEVYRDVDGKEPIQIISAYRSPATNAMLRRRSSGVARHSQHMLGHAMDFFIPGVQLEQVRYAGLRLQRGGVGFYPTSGSPFVHLDTGSIRHWPRMTHDQLARVFPDGRTVHIPSDGVPLKNYELAMADVQRRGGSNDSGSAPRARSFLASLFSTKSDDEDEGGTAEPMKVSATTSGAPAAKSAEAKSVDMVPLPRIRPPVYQVASAVNDAPAAAGKPAKTTKQPTVVDIINARGTWGDDRTPKQPADALKVASLKARFAATFAEQTASVDATTIKPWSADDRPNTKPQALAYAAPPSAAPASFTERAHIVAASAPIPRSIRPAAATTTVKVDSVVAKGPQPVPTTLAQVSPKQSTDPWLRAVMLAPNFHYAMLAKTYGEPDMTALRALFVKPDVTITMTFSNDPTPSLVCERFTGSATAVPSTIVFAALTRQ
jgi:uncharacterized protein YcbK (DUF882 family)